MFGFGTQISPAPPVTICIGSAWRTHCRWNQRKSASQSNLRPWLSHSCAARARNCPV